MNQLGFTPRFAAFALALITTFVFAKFLDGVTENWQVAPTALMLLSMIAFALVFAIRTNKYTLYMTAGAMATFFVGADWFFMSAGNRDMFYPVHGAIALGALVIILAYGCTQAIRRQPAPC